MLTGPRRPVVQGATVSGDARELELDKTAKAPAGLDRTKAASVPPMSGRGFGGVVIAGSF